MSKNLTMKKRGKRFRRQSKDSNDIANHGKLPLILFVITTVIIGICLKFVTKSSGHLNYIITNFDGRGRHMKTVRVVLDKFGREAQSEDFDLMWSYRYPFGTKKDELKHVKPHQKYNHFPFITHITYKPTLVTTLETPWIPKAFKFPEDKQKFLEYARKNPHKRFVVKNNSNRGVLLKNVTDIKMMNDKEKFVQEFVEDPLLIDGLVFDVGVFVLITSLDPLRLYMFDDEILVRFCAEKYHPLDPKNIRQYVIHEAQENIWTVPSTAKFYYKTKSLRKSLEAHLEARGYNVRDMWEQIEEIVVSVVLAKEERIVSMLHQYDFYEKKQNFFELVRFDFILDSKLKVHLMEVNLSPNLTPPEPQYSHHRHGYERVVRNVVNLIGWGDDPWLLGLRGLETKNCKNSSRETQGDCHQEAISTKNLDITDDFQIATLEFQTQGLFKRVFPSKKFYNEEISNLLSEKNQIMANWYKNKCNDDESWC